MNTYETFSLAAAAADTAYPHRVLVTLTRDVDPNQFYAVRDQWCVTNCGRCGLGVRSHTWHLDPTADWIAFAGAYLFRDPDHAFAFKMRWV